MANLDHHNPDQCARAWHVLRLAHRKIEQELERALHRECGLSLNEFDALLLLHLEGSGGCRMQDLIGPVALSQPALSRLISRLEDRGLVEREPGPGDGRVTLVQLTGDGRNLVARAISIHATTIEAELTDHLTPHQQEALLEILSQVASA